MNAITNTAETTRQKLYRAAIGGMHDIDSESVTIKRDPRLEGNALSQLADRLDAALSALLQHTAAPQQESVAWAVVSVKGGIHKLSIKRESAERKATAWETEWPDNKCSIRPLGFLDAAPVAAQPQNGNDLAYLLEYIPQKHVREEAKRKLAQLAAPSVPEGLIELLQQIRPKFGAVGSRDVDVRAQQNRIDAAIAMLSAAPAAQSPVIIRSEYECRREFELKQYHSSEKNSEGDYKDGWGAWPVWQAAWEKATAAQAPSDAKDAEILDWLQEEIVDTIYMDDGRVIDVGGKHQTHLRTAIRAAMQENGNVREKFEAHLAHISPNTNRKRLPNGRYEAERVEDHWQGWLRDNGNTQEGAKS